MLYAKQFSEISNILEQRADLRDYIINLIDQQPIPGKVTEGNDRLLSFREILKSLVKGQISLVDACVRTEKDLPRELSIHAANNKVFASGWAERLIRTQYSRFYNQAVMEILLAAGQTKCFVPHSTDEDQSTNCSMLLAGRIHDLKTLYDRLIDTYANGNWSKDPKIPDHPHCTHVITPIENQLAN